MSSRPQDRDPFISAEADDIETYVPFEQLEPGTYTIIATSSELPRDTTELAFMSVSALFPELDTPEELTAEQKAFWLAFTSVVADLTVKGSDHEWQFFSDQAIQAFHARVATHGAGVVALLQAFDRFIITHRNKFIYKDGVKDQTITPEILFKGLYADFNRIRTARRKPGL